MISNSDVGVIKQVLSASERRFHEFGPKLSAVSFISPGTEYAQLLQTKLVWGDGCLGLITNMMALV